MRLLFKDFRDVLYKFVYGTCSSSEFSDDVVSLPPINGAQDLHESPSVLEMWVIKSVM